MTNYRKKLIEVALPLEAINVAGQREQSIRSGHPSAIPWWSRKPLSVARAVLFASLVDDPSAHPDDFPDEDSQEDERRRLFGIIEELIKWENTQNSSVIAEAQTEIGRHNHALPIIVDPFAGGGSIPLSAQLLGLDVEASDLNPVAVLINKALLELPPKFEGHHPIGPTKDQILTTDWPGASGLAEDVNRYSRWLDQQARDLIGHNYPTVAIPSSEGGGRATVIAWIWANTVICTNPACGAIMPLLTTFALSRRKDQQAWLEPLLTDSTGVVKFRIRRGPGCPQGGTVTRSNATCLTCGTVVPLKEVRATAQEKGLGSQLLCTVAEGDRRRLYIEADDEQTKASKVDISLPILGTSLPWPPALGIRVQGYGIMTHDQLFTARQLQTLVTFTDLLDKVFEKVITDGGDDDYANAIVTYLSLVIIRMANRGSRHGFYNPASDMIEQAFTRPALQMIWAYAEANPFSNKTGNFQGQVRYLAGALSKVPASGNAQIRLLDARTALAPARISYMVCTDPPYYDNIPYADLSDFFYVWLRRCLKNIYPDLFNTILVPKSHELIAEPARHQGSRDAADRFFEDGLRQSFESILTCQDDKYPFTIFYAFKQAENEPKGDNDKRARASTGWATMLQGMLNAGATITGTWPVRTERPGRPREHKSAALASSIVLVCRHRPADAPLTTRRDFISALRAELPDALRRLQQGNIAPVDLAQASIGPGMAVFSRYSKVIEADGTTMPVRAALAVINQVLDEVLASQEADFDGDTRWAVAWFEQHGLNEGSAGMAETLSKAKNTSIGGLVQAGILEQRGNKCRLLNRGELDEDWTPGGDERITVWEVVQHLIRTLDTEGEAAAGALLASVGGLGEPARELAYRLYATCEKKGWSEEALAYNGLVVAWPELVKSAGRLQTAGADARLFD